MLPLADPYTMMPAAPRPMAGLRSAQVLNTSFSLLSHTVLVVRTARLGPPTALLRCLADLYNKTPLVAGHLTPEEAYSTCPSLPASVEDLPYRLQECRLPAAYRRANNLS